MAVTGSGRAAPGHSSGARPVEAWFDPEERFTHARIALPAGLVGTEGLAMVFTSAVLSWMLAFLLFAGSAAAACVPMDKQRRSVEGNQDPVARVLAAAADCPTNVFKFRERLVAAGAQIQTARVNNQGFHNPNRGNFSMFEMVVGTLRDPTMTVEPGEFFFGHFTERRNDTDTLVANQRPRGLMIELIAWDPSKELFNFYELIGNGQRGEWFYRGDSLDIVADTRLLHRQPNPQNPEFGNRLRCSGCHLGGGPILKELASPHNDWWTATRPLPFGDLNPDDSLKNILKGQVDADVLAKAVIAGASRLEQSSKLLAARRGDPLQEQLRPLFCPVELNLESDGVPVDVQQATITVPSAFVVDPRLARDEIRIARAQYEAALAQLDVRFPGTTRHDADHAWLTPVKAASDMRTVDGLISRKVVDRQFVHAVLAVDMTNPALSTGRCRLLRHVPARSTDGWLGAFKAALGESPDRAAKELLRNLTDPERQTAEFHQNRAGRFLKKCQQQLEDPAAVLDFVRLLARRRVEVYESEISRNPEGQILEPGQLPDGGISMEKGFKLVFPLVPSVQPFKARPSLRLSEECVVVRD